MNKLLIGLLALVSLSALASEKTCKQAYVQYYERNEMLRELFKAGEISDKKFDSRVEDSFAILKVSTPVMCRGVSEKKQKMISALILGEVLGID
jgi:uncharacterized membrane protein